MNPVDGLRTRLDAHAIAHAEWAAQRSSVAVWNILSGYRPGDSELAAAARMGLGGPAMNCHPMFSSSGPEAPILGMRSPTARVPALGDGATTCVSFPGGLTARAGLLAEEDDGFLALAQAYYGAQAAWYATARIGVAGGEIEAAVAEALAPAGIRSMLNPGHLTGYDEWVHSPVFPGSELQIRSGMPFQVDIIPVPLRNGWALNCEDPVTFADAGLRGELARLHPEVAARCAQRRAFVSAELGIDVPEDLLLLSNTPLCLAAPGPTLAPQPPHIGLSEGTARRSAGIASFGRAGAAIAGRPSNFSMNFRSIRSFQRHISGPDRVSGPFCPSASRGPSEISFR